MTYQTCELCKALLTLNLMQLRVSQKECFTPEREQDIRVHLQALVELEKEVLAA